MRRALQLTAFFSVLAILAGVSEHLRGKALVRTARAELENTGIQLGLEANSPIIHTNSQFSAALTNIVSTLPALPDRDLDIPLPPAMQSLGNGIARVTWKEARLHVPGRRGKTVFTNLWEGLQPFIEPNRDRLRRLCIATEKSDASFIADWRTGFQFPDIPFYELTSASRWLMAAASFDMRHEYRSEALQFLIANIRCAHVWNNAPSLIFKSRLFYTIDIAFESQWELLQYDGWTDAQLAACQNEWEKVDLLDSLPTDTLWEHAVTWNELGKYRTEINKTSELFWQLCPSTNQVPLKLLLEDPLAAAVGTINTITWPLWLSYHDEAKSLELLQETVSMMHRLHATSSLQSAQPDFANLITKSANRPSYYLAAQYSPGKWIKLTTTRKFEYQTLASLAATAIAVKRHTLRFGESPENLQQLAPDIRPGKTIDYMCGRPLQYTRTEGKQFKLWSVGTDFIDGNGDTTPTRTRYRHAVRHSADWVWPQAGTEEDLRAHQLSTGLIDP